MVSYTEIYNSLDIMTDGAEVTLTVAEFKFLIEELASTSNKVTRLESTLEKALAKLDQLDLKLNSVAEKANSAYDIGADAGEYIRYNLPQ